MPLTDDAGREAAPSTSRPRTRRRWSTCASAARRSAATCRRAGARRDAAADAAAVGLRARCSRAPASARSRRRWRSCASLDDARCATRASASTSCRSCPTSRARSAWRGCSASSASSPRSASSTRREDAEQLMFYREDKNGPDPRRKASTRPGAMSSWIAAGDVVLEPRRADDPVLHLLLDVRLPARRRPRLGRGRHAARAASCSAAPPGARRSTARACSTRTATAHVLSATIPNCVSYDPTYALRGRGDHPATACGGCSPSRRTSSTTSR